MSGATILIVDDDRASRYVKGHLLARHGYDVLEAGSGHEALQRLAERSIALVLLDVQLPDRSGLAVCQEIKERFPQSLVLQTSAAFTDVADRTSALEGGADSYLVEPIEPAELLAIVRALLRMRDAEQQLRRMNDDLEAMVAARTRELVETNRRLAAEMEDRRKAEAALWHAQKLDLISRFTGGIAHDFNNLLTIIGGNLELMHAALDGPTPKSMVRLKHMLSVAEAATENGGKITQQLLAFARRSPAAPGPVRLSDLVVGWQDLLTQALGEVNALEIAFPPDLWTCVVDQSQLEAALVNLVLNAKDAMPTGGRVRLAVRNAEIAAGSAQATLGVVPGQYVLLTVSDSGAGMAEGIVEHIFEPFFTTKSVGEGSGLGLSQVHGFVRQSSGHVLVESAPGTGTIFSLYFPRGLADALPASAALTGAVDEPGGTERVLIVDDNHEVREVTRQLVSSLGYKVISVANGTEAMKIMEGPDGVDLVITDVVMPGELDGLELARRIRVRSPELPVLLVTGYSTRFAEGVRGRDWTMLHKPYRSGELARHIRAALDQRSPPRRDPSSRQ